MKILIVLWAGIFFIPCVFCNDSILSKLHQHGYKLKDVRVELHDYDEDFYNFYRLKAFKFNRTTTAHNASLNLKVNVEDKLEVLVQAHKFLSNEYRHFPLRFQVNLKKAVDSNAIGSGRMKDCGNITTFYFHKDVTYQVCNFVIDETRFPPLIPNGKYRVDLIFLYFNREIATHHVYLEVYTPIEYPK